MMAGLGRARRPRVLYSATSQNSMELHAKGRRGSCGQSQGGSSHYAWLGFTLVRTLSSVLVLAIVVPASYTPSKTAQQTVLDLGHKQMDVDSQARQLIDRTAIRFRADGEKLRRDYTLSVRGWFNG